MNFLEKDLEHFIFNKIELANVNGLDIGTFDKFYRQKKISNYGTADIIGFSRQRMHLGKKVDNIQISIIECKRDLVSISTFCQALKYIDGIKDYIRKRKLFTDYDIDYKIILVGKRVDNHSLSMVRNNVWDLSTYEYYFNENNLLFKNSL